MNRLDKAIVAWGKGNKKARYGEYTFTKLHIFQNSVPIASRYRDVEGKAIIIMRAYYGEKLVDSIITPARHFSNRPHFLLSDEDYRVFSVIITHLDEHKLPHYRRVEIGTLQEIGMRIAEMRRLCTKYKIDHVMVSRHSSDDHVILGALYCFSGKIEAICQRQEGWQKSPIRGRLLLERYVKPRYALFAKMDDAVLCKMAHPGVQLYDLTN
jgi:hypothetical protein